MGLISFSRGTTPTGSWSPSRNPAPLGYGGSEDYFQASAQSEGGDLYVYDKGINPRQIIPLRWPAMSRANFYSLMTFYEAMKGRRYSFTFTEFNAATQTARFYDSPDWSWITDLLVSVSFSIFVDAAFTTAHT